ncbi:MAG: hypothetical protein KME29_38405 [Calothrix sp. FI2-JRJ7]|jgi:uncharacterized protein YihD (DUF1040 family)|nr:hypothetical protein [Calothrix sp. FI2-JRJ7]
MTQLWLQFIKDLAKSKETKKPGFYAKLSLLLQYLKKEPGFSGAFKNLQKPGFYAKLSFLLQYLKKEPGFSGAFKNLQKPGFYAKLSFLLQYLKKKPGFYYASSRMPLVRSRSVFWLVLIWLMILLLLI